MIKKKLFFGTEVTIANLFGGVDLTNTGIGSEALPKGGGRKKVGGRATKREGKTKTPDDRRPPCEGKPLCGGVGGMDGQGDRPRPRTDVGDYPRPP